MRTRAVAASLAIHAAIVVALIASSVAVKPPSIVDVEIVPAITAEVAPPPRPPPPPVVSTKSGGAPGPRAIDRAPPRRSEPPRRPPPAHRPPAPAPVPDEPAALATVEVEPAGPPAAASDGTGEATGGGGGTGSGTGGGRGDGAGDLDLSARPVPLNASLFATLPYTEAAARDRVSGYVYLVLTVDPIGHVGRATVRRGLGHGLDEIATRLAMQIAFRPARDRAGRPIVATVTWRFYFEPP